MQESSKVPRPLNPCEKRLRYGRYQSPGTGAFLLLSYPTVIDAIDDWKQTQTPVNHQPRPVLSMQSIDE